MTDKSQSPGSKETRAWDFGWAEAEGLSPFQRLTGGICLSADDSEISVTRSRHGDRHLALPLHVDDGKISTPKNTTQGKQELRIENVLFGRRHQDFAIKAQGARDQR